MQKILTVIGARPQFIKAAVVSRAISEYSYQPSFQEIIVHTGQHYDPQMSEIFFREMRIAEPGYWLGVGGGSHGQMTGQMLERIEEVLLKEKPDIVLVYGDTNSTLAGALAASKLHIPVAHVEAGLRSFNMAMPEEVNRILTDQISTWLFCPTNTAINNLINEGFDQRSNVALHQVGDVMYDAALFYKKLAEPTEQISKWVKEKKSHGFYMATLHRAENTDNPERLHNIMATLQQISTRVPVILPLHPRTKGMLKTDYPGINFISPVGYFDMIMLLSHCRGVFTDSGGVQKEAYFFKKPCITLRDETEWVELVETGVNILAGADSDRILTAESKISDFLNTEQHDLYGDGDAGEKIASILAKAIC